MSTHQLLVEYSGLSGMNSTVIKHLSLGQKQRLGLARALWRNPNTLILDEPTNGLDPQGILDIREMILGLHKEGRNVIVASHLISEVLHCCTHVLVLHQGNVRYFGTLNSLKKDAGLLIDSVDRSSMIELLKLQNISFVEQIDGIQIDGSHSQNDQQIFGQSRYLSQYYSQSSQYRMDTYNSWDNNDEQFSSSHALKWLSQKSKFSYCSY